jgi:glycosyltransferase involved in cell wall biosynthesis
MMIIITIYHLKTLLLPRHMPLPPFPFTVFLLISFLNHGKECEPVKVENAMDKDFIRNYESELDRLIVVMEENNNLRATIAGLEERDAKLRGATSAKTEGKVLNTIDPSLLSNQAGMNSPVNMIHHLSKSTPSIVILVICYNRPDYLRRTLVRLLEHHPSFVRNTQLSAYDFSIIVSQDGSNGAVKRVIDDYKSIFTKSVSHVGPTFLHVQHTQVRFDPPTATMCIFILICFKFLKEKAPGQNAYENLAKHFGWALQQVFDENGPVSHAGKKGDYVLIVEDDLEIAPDFYEFFASTTRVLEADDTIFCASAYNDNGKRKFVSDPSVIVRSDFFPGLGWMVSRKIWNELSPKWPNGYWDDWLREPSQRKDRVCVRPEISRTKTFGELGGASNGQFFEKHLATIYLNEEYFHFLQEDMSLLEKTSYDQRMSSAIKKARMIKDSDLKTCVSPASAIVQEEVVLYYKGLEKKDGPTSFESIGNLLLFP